MDRDELPWRSWMLLQFYVIRKTDVDLLSSRIEAVIPIVDEQQFYEKFSTALSCTCLGHF